MQVASIAACLPEQLNRTRDSGSSLSLMSRRAVGSSPGSDGGHWRSFSVSPAMSRMSRTALTWKSSPEWLAAASASSSPSSGSPARTIAVACIGLFDDRGNTGVFALPRVSANVPSALSAATAPRCRDSVNPDRITSASTGLADMSCRITCTLSRVPAPVRAVLPVDLSANQGATPYFAGFSWARRGRAGPSRTCVPLPCRSPGSPQGPGPGG